MIFLVTGRIGSGTHHFVEKMKNSGYHDVLPELVKMDGHIIPTYDDNLPSYAVAKPDQIKEILKTFPNELFHVIYTRIDENDGKTRRDWYINECENSDDASKMFDKLNSEESTMYDKFETLLDLKDPSIPDNFRAVHTFINDYNPTILQEQVDYFIGFHRMYLRLIKIAKLSIKVGVVNTDKNENIILFCQGISGTPNRQFVTPEKFADILIADNMGLAMAVKTLLEKADTNDLADILSN